MKNTFALALILFVCSTVALAQHINVVNSTGNNNTVSVDQQFNGPGTSYDGNEAYVDQVGNINDANVYQENDGFAGSGQWAKSLQEGNDNDAEIEQFDDGHTGEITQDGIDNNGDIFQRGSETDAEIWTQGNDNDARITIYGTSVGGTTSGYIEQIGNFNDANQKMGDLFGCCPGYVDNSWFQSYQYGNRNESDQMMEGNGFPGSVLAIDNTGYILQDGNDNIGLQHMLNGTGIDMMNDASLNQDGNANTSYQYQSNDNNSSSVNQIGNNNNSVSNQN